MICDKCDLVDQKIITEVDLWLCSVCKPKKFNEANKMNTIIEAYLVVDCPLYKRPTKFQKCKECIFNEYESVLEYKIECSYGIIKDVKS